MGIISSFTADSSDLTITPPSSTPTVNDQGGGHVTYKLGSIGTPSNTTINFTPSGTANEIYRCGSWVTDPAPPNNSGVTRQITTSMEFFFHRIYGYEGATNENAYFCWRIGMLEYTPGTGDVETDHTYRALTNGWILSGSHNTITGSGETLITGFELGTTSADGDPYGGAGVGSYGSDLIPVNTSRTFGEDDRLMIEWGIYVTTNKTSQIGFEFGGQGDDPDDVTSGHAITFGSEVVVPMNFTEEFQDAWGSHAELHAGSGSEITFANITATRAWQSADWSDADRIVTRRGTGSNITAQQWAKTDNEFLYVCTNNIIDGCIQDSDHSYLFVCGSDDWRSSTTPDASDYIFSIDINGKETQTDNPSTISEGGGTETGGRIWRGAGSTSHASTFPYGWQESVWHTGTGSHTPRGAEFRAVDNTAVDTDAFTNTDGTTLTTHNAKWISYQHTSGSMEINTNRARGLVSQTNEGGYRNSSATGKTNCAVEVDWTVISADTTWNGIMLRIDTGFGGTHYEFRFAASGTNNVEIRRFSSGTPTSLVQQTVGSITTETIRVRAECYGTQTRLCFNGRVVAEYNDAAGSGISNSGNAGIFVTNSNNAFDNFNYAEPDAEYTTEFWEEGVDFRFASETGGTTTAPDPNTDDVSTVSKSARTTFKIKKRKIVGWNGYGQLGFGMNMQCDVQGQGNTYFPGALGNQLDKPGWNYFGENRAYNVNRTDSSSATNGSDLAMQPLMVGHAHDDDPYKFYFAGIF